jgi:hypothetical protein
MDIHKILVLLHEERRRVNDVILSLERLSQGPQARKNVPTAPNQQIVEGGKRTRTVSPVARAKMPKLEPKVKTKAAGS